MLRGLAQDSGEAGHDIGGAEQGQHQTHTAHEGAQRSALSSREQHARFYLDAMTWFYGARPSYGAMGRDIGVAKSHAEKIVRRIARKGYRIQGVAQ